MEIHKKTISYLPYNHLVQMMFNNGFGISKIVLTLWTNIVQVI